MVSMVAPFFLALHLSRPRTPVYFRINSTSSTGLSPMLVTVVVIAFSRNTNCADPGW